MQKRHNIFRVLSFLLLAIFALSGCSLPNSIENTTLSANEEGAITETIIEAQSEDNYTEEELKEYIEAEVAAFNGTDSEAVQLDSCSVKNETVKIVMTYASYQDYVNFNGMELFLGTIAEAEEAGYSLDDATLLDADSNAADLSQIEERKKEWKVIVLSEPVYVRAPDKILYASDNVTITGRLAATVNTVLADDEVSTDTVSEYASAVSKYAYIIYK